MPNTHREYPLVDSFPVMQQDRVGALLAMDGKIEWVNGYAEEFFSRADVDLIGRHFMELTHPEWIGIDLDLFKMLQEGSKSHYTIPRKVWLDPFGKDISGRLFAAKCKVNGEEKIYTGVTPYLPAHTDLPHVNESGKSYTAFGLPSGFWRGVANLIEAIDVWKLLIVTTGVVMILYLLKDMLPMIWGGS